MTIKKLWYEIVKRLLLYYRKHWSYDQHVEGRLDPTSVVELQCGPFEIIDAWGIEVRWKGHRVVYQDGLYPKRRWVRDFWFEVMSAASDIVYPPPDPDDPEEWGEEGE